MDILYKGILKNYSVQLADKMSSDLLDKNEIYENIITKYDKFIIKKIGKTSISLKSFDINDKRDITTKYSSYSANKNDYIGVA